MKSSLIFLILLPLLLSCSTTNGDKKEAVELNDRAVELMSQQFMACGEDSILMDSIYKASIEPVLRLGIGFCYIKKGEVDKAQEVLQRVSNEFLINGDSVNYYFTGYFIDGKGYKKY